MLKPKIRMKLVELDKRQNKVSKDLNISPQRFSNWVNGSSYPNLEEAFKLSIYLGCSVEDLWEYKEDGNESKE